MNKKIQFIVIALLITVITATSFLGTAEACGWGHCWGLNKYYSYKADAILDTPVVTYKNDSGAPFLIIVEGYRPITSVIQCTITINGVEYSYPDDFDYEEIWRMEINAVAGEANLTVETTYRFFNLPCKPTLSEHIVAKETNINSPEPTYDGKFTLSGTKQFFMLRGGGSDQAYYEGEEPNRVMIVSRTGLIKGLPFGLR